MALIRAEVQTIQDYLERVKKSQDKRFWRRKVGEGEESGREGLRCPSHCWERDFCLWRGNFASGEEILPVFYPKSTFPKRKENPDGSSRGARAVEGETPPQGVIRPLIN